MSRGSGYFYFGCRMLTSADQKMAHSNNAQVEQGVGKTATEIHLKIGNNIYGRKAKSYQRQRAVLSMPQERSHFKGLSEESDVWLM